MRDPLESLLETRGDCCGSLELTDRVSELGVGGLEPSSCATLLGTGEPAGTIGLAGR